MEINMPEEMTHETMFDKFFNNKAEVLKVQQKPMIENKIKMKLTSAYDNSVSQSYEAELKLSELRSDLTNYDLNSIIEQLDTLAALEIKKKQVRDEYKAMFGKEYPVTL